MSYRILLRKDTPEKWVYNNPVLMEGEPGVEIGTKRMKIGDGYTPWNDLQYVEGVTGPAGNAGATGAAGVTGPSGPVSGIDNLTDTFTSVPVISHIVTSTQAEYDAIAVKDTSTLYIIV